MTVPSQEGQNPAYRLTQLPDAGSRVRLGWRYEERRMSGQGDELAGKVFDARCAALALAVEFSAGSYQLKPADVERLADRWLGYLLSQTVVLRVRVSPATFRKDDPASSRPTQYTDLGGGAVAVTMQDNEYVTLTADPTDAAGNPTADSGLTWAADNTALVTLVPSADGTMCNAGAAGGLGTVNITVTDAAGVVSPADPITITAGPPTTLGIAAGTPVVIPPGGVPVPA